MLKDDDRRYPFALSVTAPSAPCSELVVRFELNAPAQAKTLEALQRRVDIWLDGLTRNAGGVLPIGHVDLDQVSPLTVELGLYRVSCTDDDLQTFLDIVSDMAELVSVEVE